MAKKCNFSPKFGTQKSLYAIFNSDLDARRPTRTVIVNMTSQNWLTEKDVTRTLWYHDLVICIPYDYNQGIV